MLVVGEVLRLSPWRHADQDAVIDERGRRTYAELAARAWGLARGLLEAGVRPGDTVGVLTGNSVFSAEAYLGVVAAGAVAVFYNWRWPEDLQSREPNRTISRSRQSARGARRCR